MVVLLREMRMFIEELNCSNRNGEKREIDDAEKPRYHFHKIKIISITYAAHLQGCRQRSSQPLEIVGTVGEGLEVVAPRMRRDRIRENYHWAE